MAFFMFVMRNCASLLLASQHYLREVIIQPVHNDKNINRYKKTLPVI